MKTILILCLICLTLSEDSETSQYNRGPAHNYKHEQSEKYCEEYFVYTPETKWYEDEYLDIAETMRKIEQGDRDVWKYDNIPTSKVYQLDCHSTFVKVLTGASILLALIL